MDARSQRKLFFKNLDAALWSEDEGGDHGTFAGGGDIAQGDGNNINPLLESLHVEGAGELQLPLSSEDFTKLLRVSQQAPYGRGLATVVNPAVRLAWQVDASKVTFPRSQDFVSRTIRRLANEAVRALGLNGPALQMEARLYKLLLYEVDGHFSLHRDTEKEPGMFATLILQLPTQGGFEGGALVVRHRGATKTFDFSLDSATKFSYTVFYADCQHALQRITSGKRLCLAFNLVRGRSVMPLGTFKKFSSRLSKVEKALLPWRNSESAQDVFPSDKLAIPLQHKYTEKNLSFSGLKGDDRIVAHVLENCRDDLGRPWLDLYLCIYTLHKVGVPEETYGHDDYDDEDEEDDDEDNDDDDDDGDRDRDRHSMGDIIEESSECSNWVDINNKPCNLTLQINEAYEVVVDEEVQDEVFDADAEPDDVEYEGHTGNAGPTLEYWYHKAMIVIWPRRKSIILACKNGIAGALDILETRVKEGDADTATMLHEVVSYSERSRAKIFSYGNRVAGSRLLKICINAGGLEDVVRVLKLLSEPFKTEGYRSQVCTIGIVDADASTAIARAVHTHGWDHCGAYVLKMLGKEQLREQGRYFAQLALELHKLGCEEAGLLVARRILAFVEDSPVTQLQGEMIVSMGKLLVCFKECMSESGLKFAQHLDELNTDVLCSLVIQVFAMFSNEVTQELEDGVSGAFVFRRMCQVVTTRDFHRPTLLESHVVELVWTFSRLGNEELLNNLIQALLDQSRVHKQQQLLKKLLCSNAIWTALSGTVIGRRLINERILVLSQPQPPFTWCMPSAQFPRHPDVQAFLRGPSERLTYTGVNDFKHATNFANKYFGYSGYHDGYSADAKASFERGYACCVITKTRAAFRNQCAQWKREQQAELPRLIRQRREELQNAGNGGSGRVEAVDLSSDASQKRRKVEKTEYIDLTLDDNE